MRTSVIVRFQFEGVHSWPGAPAGREQHLAFPHRHVFHVEAVKDVSHDDRDVEFIGLKRDMETFVDAAALVGPHSYSCEMMAEKFLVEFQLRSCRVFEDNENGAEVSE